MTSGKQLRFKGISMFIRENVSTTKEEAIDMAFEFGSTLKNNGWFGTDLRYAEALWIDEYKDKTLYPYLLFGFRAGYLGEEKPTVAYLESNGKKELAQ